MDTKTGTQDRYRHCRTGWDLGEAHALDVQVWYFSHRDIFPLIEAYQKRKRELDAEMYNRK